MCIICSCGDTLTSGSDAPKAKCTVVVDWTDFEDNNLTGMTAIFYPQTQSSEIYVKRVNIGSSRKESLEFSLPTGTYNLLVFNQTESEFANLAFASMDSFSQARVFVKDEESGDDVDWFAVATQTNVTITEQMASSGSSTEISLRPVTINKPLTVKLRVKGIQNALSMFDCSITGLSSGRYLSTDNHLSGTVEHDLKDWKIRYIDTEKTSAVDSTTIRTFGFVDDPSCSLTLSFYLRDKSTVSNFDYSKITGSGYFSSKGNQIVLNIGFMSDETQESSDNADPSKIILLPDVEAPQPQGGGGFKVTLDEWAPPEEIDIKID